MSDLPITNWPIVAAVLLLLFLAALAGPGCRPPPAAVPPTIPRLDLSLWISGQGHPSQSWPFRNTSPRALRDDSWAGYYDQQFASVLGRLRH